MPASSGDDVSERRSALDGIECACLADRVDEPLLAAALQLDVPGGPFGARARYLRGNVQYRLDHDDDAIVAFREAEAMAEAEGDCRTQAMAVLRQCEWAVFHGRWMEADERLPEALRRAGPLGDPHLCARAEDAAATAAVHGNRWPEARRRYDDAKRLYGEAGRTHEATRCGKRSTQIEYRAELRQRLLPVVEEDAARRGEIALFCEAMLQEGLESLDEPERGIALLDRVLELGALPPYELAEARSGRGVCRSRLGDDKGAFEDYSLVCDDVAADPETRAQVKVNLLLARLSAGDALSADETSALFNDEMPHSGTLPVSVQLARSYYDLRGGNFEAALQHLDGCPGASGGDFHLRAHVAQLRSYVLSALGRNREAIDVCVAVWDKTPESASFLRTLLTFRIGTLLQNIGEYVEASEAFSEAAEALEDLAPSSDLHWLSRVFAIQASLIAGASTEGVRDELQRLLESVDPSAPPVAVGLALQLRARETDSPDDAIRAAELFLAANLPIDTADALDDAAILFASSGRTSDAINASRRAARLLDETVALAPDDDNRVGTLARTRYARARLVELLHEASPREALEEVVRAKSGALLRLLSHRLAAGNDVRVQQTRAAVSSLLQPTTERAVASVARGGQVRAAVPFAIPPPALDEVRALYRELTQADRVAHGLHAEREVSVDAIIGALPEDGALLEVFPTRDWLYAFVISRGSVRCTRVERTETFDDALETAVRDLRLGSTVGIWHERRLRGALRRLHAGLLGDTATSLDGVSRLWISPGAELMGVPWPALIGQDGASLVDRFELTMLLSGAQLALPRPARERSRLALVRGNDGPRPLSAADLEVDEIARMFAAQGWAVDRCGPETARSGIDEAIQRASVFHFSGHAGFCEAEGMAALLATPERPLVAAEILGLDLRAARLAVLSACETGRGEAHTGDELVGLLRAFFAAGCQAVLASRWLADDATTTFVMLATYERWLAGERLAEALREAQRQLRAIVPDQPLHPFFWANFALYGVE